MQRLRGHVIDRIGISVGVLLVASAVAASPACAQGSGEPSSKSVLKLQDDKLKALTWNFEYHKSKDPKIRTFTVTPPLSEAELKGIAADFPNGLENENNHGWP